MSDHAWILENLAAYLTDGLESVERERLEQHVDECPSCAAALAEARTTDEALTGLFVEARPSAALEDRVIQTLRTRRAENEGSLPVAAWFGIAAAALVLIGISGFLANQALVSGDASAARVTREAEVDLALARQAESEAETARFAGENRLHALYGEGKSHFEPRRPSSPAPAKEENREPNATPPVPGAVDPAQPSNTPPSGGMMGGVGMPGGMPGGGMGMMGGMMGMTGGGGMPGGMMGMMGGGGMPGGVPPGVVTPTNGSPPSGFQPGKVLATAAAAEGSQSGGGKGNSEPSAAKPPTKDDKKQLNPAAPQQRGPRKIVIRTGEIEYEVASFDAAVATITRLVKSIKGGFVATVSSDKVANGKVRGTVVVRVPPENLDELVLELRTTLGKNGEPKNQRITSLDVGKEYTDLESRLKAARAMEERLLQIIKNGKGEIKDLLAVEKELGEWRTRIEKLEGELRWLANQVALSTLSITLTEKEMEAAIAVVERENVQMGIVVEDVDQAYQAAQKAVREAKGRITHAELKQPSPGQFSAQLKFDVSADAAGPLRDRLKQLGSVDRLDVTRVEENEGGKGKPSDGKLKRRDTHFHVHFYNLTDVPPQETVYLSLACLDVEAAMKTLTARVDKAAGRMVASSLNSSRGQPAASELQFQVKTTLADAVLEDVKQAGEVMSLQVRETAGMETTRKKRGFVVKLLAVEAATARETDEIQLACTDVAASYRGVLEVVNRIKGRVRKAQLDEQDRLQMTAVLDVEVPRTDEAALRAALTTAGEIYTRKVSRAADADTVVDSKVRWQIAFINQASIPPRETYQLGVEVSDVDQTAAMLSALVSERQGRTVKANVSREANGRITGTLTYDVPLAKVHELLDHLRSAGRVRVQQSTKHAEVPDSPLALARLEVTLSNKELIVPSDEGFGSSIHSGLADSFKILAWSLRILIFGLCIVLPWALVVWAIYRLVLRLRRRTTPSAPAA